MRTEQRKLRKIVIEPDVVSPTQFPMAFGAILAKLHLVRIVILVTTHA